MQVYNKRQPLPGGEAGQSGDWEQYSSLSCGLREFPHTCSTVVDELLSAGQEKLMKPSISFKWLGLHDAQKYDN